MPAVRRSPGDHFSIKRSCLEFPYELNQTRPRIKLAELRLFVSPSDIFALSHSGRNVKLRPATRSAFSLVVDLPSRSGITWASLREGSAGYCQGG